VDLNLIPLAVIALAIIIKVVHETKEYNKKKILDFAIGLIEEGISYSEEKNKMMKREAAANAGKALQKQPVEVTKDQVSVDKFFTSAMVPVRQIAHDTARDYILSSVEKLPSGKFKNVVQKIYKDCLDHAINMRISAAKMGIQDPLRPMFYRSV
jgi:hypothetical protein